MITSLLDRRGSVKHPVQIPLFDVKSQNLSIREELEPAVADVLARGSFIGGPHLESFEQAFARFCNCRRCVGVGNGTDALFLALKALGIGDDDEVITTAYSFVATAQAITRTGARVKFVDIDPLTYNMDPAKIEELLTPRTRAIVPVHLFGHPADMDSIRSLAVRYGLLVIEDAAQAHGARYRGQVVGSLGNAACFSFYPTKNLGACGDAGAIVTDDENLAGSARRWANHARIERDNYLNDGVNSRLDAMQASVLEVKLRHLQEWNRRRREIAQMYHQVLKGLRLGLPIETHEAQAVFHVFVVRIEDSRRDELRQFLGECGIETRVYYRVPLPFLKGYASQHLADHAYPEAVRASRELLALPIYPELKDSAVEYIGERIREFYESPRCGQRGPI